LPPAVVAQLSTPDALGPCTSGAGDDGDGAFLLAYDADLEVTLTNHGHFFQIQDGKAVRVGGTVIGSNEGSKVFFSQPAGFTVFNISGVNDFSGLDTWSHDGVLGPRAPIAPSQLGPVSQAPSSAASVDPSGGTAAVVTAFTDAKGFVTTYQRFDKNGVAETGQVQVDTGEHRVGGVGVALSGHALIVLSLGTPNWQAQWVARDGTAISKPFTLQWSGVPRFQFLMDGSLALGFVKSFNEPPSSFAYRIEDGAEVAGPLPAWLSQRSGNVLFAARQGRAYATWGGGGQCGADLEVLAAPSGKSCGCLKVPQLTHQASVGRDGSLIVPGQAPTTCAYDLYPKLLR
jgi:hypothetical protein